MKRLPNKRKCMRIEGEPQAGQLLSTNGSYAVWVDRIDETVDEQYSGAIRWTGSEAVVVRDDGTNGRTVQLYDNEGFNNPPNCCRQQNYRLYRIDPICIPYGGSTGQLLVYVCGRWLWEKAPAPCVALVDMSFTVTDIEDNGIPLRQYVRLPVGCARGFNIVDVSVEQDAITTEGTT